MSDMPHNFDRRQTDANYDSLNTRVTSLEDLVHNQVIPKVDRNTEMTAAIDARTDEMYSAFVTARNGVRMITAVGNGVMKVSDAIERRPKTIGLLVIAGIAVLATNNKLPEWIASAVRLLAGA
jgi:hypothetical protein